MRSAPSCPNRWRPSTTALSTNRNTAYTRRSPTSSWPAACSTSTRASAAPASTAALNPETPKDPAFYGRVEGADTAKTEKNALDFYERLRKYAFGEQDNSANAPAPGCSQQPPFEPIYGSGPATAYQHTFEQGK